MERGRASCRRLQYGAAKAACSSGCKKDRRQPDAKRSIRSSPTSQTYPTLLSGFIDPVRSSIALALEHDDETDKGRSDLEELGILDMQGLTFRCGFEGKAWRESYALHLDPQRRGIWQVLEATDNVNVDQLPALPADATSVFVGAINTGRLTNVVGKWIILFQRTR